MLSNISWKHIFWAKPGNIHKRLVLYQASLFFALESHAQQHKTVLY